MAEQGGARARGGSELGPSLTPRVAEAVAESSRIVLEGSDAEQAVLEAADLLSWDDVRKRLKKLSLPQMQALLRKNGCDAPAGGSEARISAAIELFQGVVRSVRSQMQEEHAARLRAAAEAEAHALKRVAKAIAIESWWRGFVARRAFAHRRREAADLAETARVAGEKAENWRRVQDGSTHAVVWLHGLGELEVAWQVRFGDFRLPEGAGRCRWVWPRAELSPCTARGGAPTLQWFDTRELPVRHVVRGAPDRARFDEDASEVDAAVGKVHAALGALEAEGLPPGRIVVGGFGQGAALAAHAALRYPRTLAGCALLGAWLPRAGELGAAMTEAGRAAKLLWCHGARDAVVLPAVAMSHAAALQGLGAQVDFRLFPELGFGADAEVMQALEAWIAGQLVAADRVDADRAAGGGGGAS